MPPIRQRVYKVTMLDELTQFAVLLFTDICDSTALKAKHGALEYKRAAELHNALFEKIAAEEKLTLIKNTGDGYFARTTSVAAAVRFALRFQHGMRGMAWGAFALTTRVGIHAGEVADITTLGMADVLAPAADLVARVMGLAVGGQILLTRSPFDEARHFVREHPDAVEGLSLTWLAHGPYLFKGCEEPVEVFEVGLSCHAPLVAPPDGEKAKRAVRPGDEETLGWRPACGLEVPGRGGWMLARKIGEGGFGEVWLAEQAATKQRRVFKFCFDEERLRSFKRELTFFRLIRDALGERPDIARLYDVKLDEPPFFLESEFAEHGNLVEWCEKQGGIGAVPLPRRLELMAQIAEAVAAAHSVGILHKDMKPQNVLMQSRPGGGPAPQITDFGIGALADKAALSAHAITAAGFTVNTLVSGGSGSSMTRLYAAPEQLTGKVFTVQGDVYALGVMLWQIVVGDFTRALAPGWEREVKDDILREDLADCLDGEPARRLASAAELVSRLRSLDERRAEREHERQRAATNARRKRNARLALIGGGIAAVIAVALGVGFFRERGLRQRANEAERLATSRLHHAQVARDAAENLVSEAVFGLKEKLLLVGKVSVLEDLATAAENYYAKLPADLVSDTTRRHEVRIALNRAIIAMGTSDDDAAEAACNKALGLARELSAKTPDDESLLEDQYLALAGLAGLRFGQERREDTVALAGTLDTLAADWQQRKPGSPGALRAKLVAVSLALFAKINADKDRATALAGFLEVQSIADELRKRGGETLETRVIAAVSISGRAYLMEKLGKSDSAVELYAQSDAALRDAFKKENAHPFVHDLMLQVRKWSLNRLTRSAQDRGDTALEKEAWRQTKEAVAELTALAEFEPLRLERWKTLAWLYQSSSGHARKLEGDAAWLAWTEKGMQAADRAASPRFDRATVFRVRVNTRLDVCAALCIVRPEGWMARVPKLMTETAEIVCTTKHRDDFWAESTVKRGLDHWREVIAELGKKPEQRAEMIAQAQAALAFARRLIETFPALPKLRADAVDGLPAIAAILREKGCAEAAEIEQAVAAWKKELVEKFPNDPGVVGSRASGDSERSWTLLNELRAAPKTERDARFSTLESHARDAIAYAKEHEAHIKPYDFARWTGSHFLALGSAQNEMGKFAEAEASLKEAIARHIAAADSAPAPNEAAVRRWDAAVARLGLARAVFRQGREDEVRKLGAEAIEVFESQSNQSTDFRKHTGFMGLLRNYARDCFGAGKDAERLALYQRAVKAARETHRLITAATDVNESERWGISTEICYTLLECGWRSRGAGDFAASETYLREGVAIATEFVAKAAPDQFPVRARLLGNLHYDLALTLAAVKRLDEASNQVEAIQSLLTKLEQTADAKDPATAALRGWLGELQKRLATP